MDARNSKRAAFDPRYTSHAPTNSQRLINLFAAVYIGGVLALAALAVLSEVGLR